MKNFHKTLLRKTNLVGIALLLASTAINATTISFIDAFDPNPDPLISFGSNSSYSFTHSIVTDQDGAGLNWDGTYGYNPLTDTVSNASIALFFKDESTDIVSESVQLIFDEMSFGTHIITT